MKKVTVLLALLLLASSTWLQAQTRQITGTVTSSEDGMPLPGVSVAVKGTTVGGITDPDGKYTLKSVPADAQFLEFHFVGFETKEVDIAGKSVVDVVMIPASIGLDEVVVTALGISREKKALGYAVQDVKGDELAKAKETNIVNSLTGKVAGVQITNSSGAVGSSSRVIIRGNSSFGNNQPLWIVDGVPISNAATDVSQWGDADFGNAAMDLDPANIESISVLKGANAAALYGSRAANGVILVTTKQAKSGKKGIGISVTSSVAFDKVYKTPNYQNLYGQGLVGSEFYHLVNEGGIGSMTYQEYAEENGFTYYDGDGGGVWDHVDESWGPRLDVGLNLPQFNSPLTDPLDPDSRIATPWISYPDNVKDFFETGITLDNNVTISQAAENAAVRISLSNQTISGTIPNTDLTKNSLNFNGTMNLGSRIKANASINYVNNFSANLPGQGYDGNNVMQSLGGWFGRQVDMVDLRENWQNFNVHGNPYNWNTSYHNSPYWTTYYNTTSRDRDRVFGNINLSADLTDWMTVMGRVGTDLYREMRKHVEYTKTVDYPYGYFWQNMRYNNETNIDFVTTMNKEFGDFSVNGTVGANMRMYKYNFMSITPNELTVPNLFTIGNVKGNPTTTMTDREFETFSVYGQASLGWKRTLFLDITARNDWSSTLPSTNWSYFYPSFTGSFILTELLELDPTYISFAKLRGGWAQVGNDTDPYQLLATFEAEDDTYGGVSMFHTNRTLPPLDLLPEITTSMEAGLEMKFLNNRLGFDVTFYDSKTTNQIMLVDISDATGYDNMLINAGEIENKGVELQFNADVLKSSSGFNWNVTVNWAKNMNSVNELYVDPITGQKVDAYQLGSSWGGMTIEARVGEPFGIIKGNGFVRDADNNLVIGSNGLPLTEDAPIELGNITPDWTGGINNSFSYKGLSLSFLIDGRMGGDLFSVSDWFGAYAGISQETAEGGIREHGLVVNGVVADADGNPTNVVNTQVVSAENYYGGYWGREENSIIDGSYIKLREIVIGFDLPKSIVQKTGFIQSANFSIVGRNLAILYTHSSNDIGIDPETGFGTSNDGMGLEQFQLPTARNIGFKLNLKF